MNKPITRALTLSHEVKHLKSRLFQMSFLSEIKSPGGLEDWRIGELKTFKEQEGGFGEGEGNGGIVKL